jgi:DNA-binding transcriptional MerR regulator
MTTRTKAPPARLLITRAVADLLRVSTATVPHWASKGLLPSPTRVGGTRLGRASDVMKVLGEGG